VEFPAGCAWSADNAASPYLNRTGGDRLDAPSSCNPATNPGGPLACSMRWSGGQPVNYTFAALPGRSYLVRLLLGCLQVMHAHDGAFIKVPMPKE
jgi:hypothetical protein